MNGYKTEQPEYVDLEQWRKRVSEDKLRYEAEAKKLTEQLESVHVELQRLEAEKNLITQVINAYEARLQSPSKRSSLQGNNLRETLIIHFADPSGKIIGKDVARMLIDIGYFADRNSADGAVYTTLGKSPFQKITRGIYRIPTDSPEWQRLRGSSLELSLQTNP